jgi:hypothetical protein
MPAKRKQPSAGSNLELIGERLEIVSLRTLLTNKRNTRTRDAAKLGDVLLPWYEKTVARPAARIGGISEIWQEHVPVQIVNRSRLVAFERGTLKVAVDSTTARSELDARLRAGLLRTLQVATKHAIHRIKIEVNGQETGG